MNKWSVTFILVATPWIALFLREASRREKIPIPFWGIIFYSVLAAFTLLAIGL